MRLADIEKHLKKFRVGIAGAGGLGSNCAIALARAGVGTLVISDFDAVEKSNLNRQYYFSDQVGMKKTIALKENIIRIRPDISIIIHTIRLDPSNICEVFKGCNVIVEAFDSSEMKSMIIETVQSEMPSIPLVVGSGMAGWGNNELIRFRKIDDTLFVCGDETSDASDDLPLLAPRVGVVANMQANVAMEILMKLK
ncbi:MAG TPA: sulfur carrier protein ThiS adenylyltransferase ThiF [Bacteroidales bacterium]|nr:sulfur carrier protein ThiS adenylyltransferase ThiF [Bacteroidales bacterium]